MKNSILVALLISVIATVSALWLDRQHAVVPASAPDTVYSGERAMTLLRHFLRENIPHTVGSEQNRVVKQRIQAWLTKQGFDHQEQRDWGCRRKWRSCAYVENVIVTIPGEVDGPYVALMAHYDSVPYAAGAGDDMSGVVAILETARAARAVGGFRHPLMLIITDGEETGLHGAEAFFSKHPLASQVGVVLNVEGSGTRGASMVLRTSQDNEWYMRLFADHAGQRIGSSLANEVFKHMPNDTDFSVAMEAGIPGIDFAFAGERNHYHTPNDGPANLDPRTVQHHGDNLFPLVLHLANSDLTSPVTGNVVYLNAYGAWLQWSAKWTLMLFAIVGSLLVIAGARLACKPVSLLLAATAIPLGLMIAGGIAIHVSMLLIATIQGGTVPWPAYHWPLRLLLLSALLLPALLSARWLAPRFSLDTLLLGGWVFVWLLCLPLAVIVPDAAAMMLPTLLLAATLLLLAAWLPTLRIALQYATLISAGFFIPSAVLMEQTQGYQLVAAVWPWIGMYVITLLPFLRGELLRQSVIVVSGMFVLSVFTALLLPAYSAHRPQYVNVLYLQNTDTQTGRLHLESESDPPLSMLREAVFESTTEEILPWYSDSLDYLAPITNARLEAPTLIVEEVQSMTEGRRVRLRLVSNRDAMRLRLYLPVSASLRSAVLNNNELLPTDEPDASDDEYIGIVLYGMQGRDASLSLDLGTLEQVTAYLADTTFALPEVATTVVSARPDDASPVHGGDRSTVFRRVQF